MKYDLESNVFFLYYNAVTQARIVLRQHIEISHMLTQNEVNRFLREDEKPGKWYGLIDKHNCKHVRKENEIFLTKEELLASL